MKSNLAALFIVLSIASTAHASAVLQVDLLTPPPHPNGAYDPGQVIDFSVAVSTDRDVPTEVREVFLGFRASSPELTLLGPDNYDGALPQPDGIPEFVFDFSTLLAPYAIAQFPNYPYPWHAYTLLARCPGFFLVIPADGSLLLGTGQVQLPEAVGTYTLDALNTEGPNGGAKIVSDFTSTTTWTAGDGQITGNSPQLVVVPEPSVTTLLITGVAMVLHRRRTSRRRQKSR